MILAEQVAISIAGPSRESCGVDLAEILRRLPKLQIVYACLGASGYLVREGTIDQYAYIVVNEDHSLVRQRFTIAHEIGHYLYEKEGIVQADEELWCDQFASYLLMPSDRLMAFEEKADLAVWSEVPAHFCVSQDALSRRIWEMFKIGFFYTEGGAVHVLKPALVDNDVKEAISTLVSPSPNQQLNLGRTIIRFTSCDLLDQQGVLRITRTASTAVHSTRNPEAFAKSRRSAA